MIPKLCRMDDYQPAIKAARSSDYCRDHYNSHALAGVELVKFEVTADQGRVTDVRTQVSHGKGQVVELDPAETNIAALIGAGLGKVVPAAKSTKTAAKTTEG